MLLESILKIRLIGKMEIVADFCQRHICVSQEILCFLHATFGDILANILSVSSPNFVDNIIIKTNAQNVQTENRRIFCRIFPGFLTESTNYLPVEPKPPVPRTESDSSSATS